MDLKRKALEWLRSVRQEANELESRAVSLLAGQPQSAGWLPPSIMIAGRDPHRQVWAQTLTLGSAVPPAVLALADSRGRSAIGQVKSGLESGTSELVIASELGFGYEFFEVKQQSKVSTKSVSRWHRFIGADWRCELDERGWIRVVMIGKHICSPFARLSAWRKGDGWIEEKTASEMTIEEGELLTAARVKLDFGGIPVVREVVLFRSIPLVLLRLLFEFDGDEIGIAWEDETKLCLVIEFDGVEDVWHSIPFGAVSMPAGYGFFSNGWTALEHREREMGLALLTRGHPRQFYRDGRLFCVLGWGGTRFSLRIPAAWDRMDRFDHKLAGKHLLEFALVPYVGDWRLARIPVLAQKFLNPARIALCGSVGNRGRRLFEIDDYTPLMLGLERDQDGSLIALGHECAGTTADMDRVFADSLSLERLIDLADNELEGIGPFRIFRARFTPAARDQ
ncbi:MAG TPA: hypothetical protein ENF73_00265 [Proteobacteria bacterium]|nr:hypothetical protein [Pseudomonadota bacterium]